MYLGYAKLRGKIACIVAMVMVLGMITYKAPIAFAEGNGNELGLDHVEITNFKIVATDRDTVFDYKETTAPDAEAYKNDPSKFSNAICQGQTYPYVGIELNIKYENKGNYLKEGDTLTIRADYGGDRKNSEAKPLVWDGNQLGTWEYKNGYIIIHFGGDYIKKNQVDKFTAYFKTEGVSNWASGQTPTFKKGERYIKTGYIGNKEIMVPFEKYYIETKHVEDSVNRAYKWGSSYVDSQPNYTGVMWYLDMCNDSFGNFENPYLLENGKYKPDSYTNIYIEDKITDCVAPPEISYIDTSLTAMTESGIVGSSVRPNIPSSMYKKIDQGSMTKEQVKAALKKGEYCMYDTKDGNYTFMMKWYDMNSDDGPKYNDIDAVKALGGVAEYLKDRSKSIFGALTDADIKKTNELYDGKTIQNIRIAIKAKHKPWPKDQEKKNTAFFTADQIEGVKESTATIKPETASNGGEGGIEIDPNKPVTPDKPVNPEQPDKPITPEQPDKPVTPEQPAKPVTTEQPAKPSPVVPYTGDESDLIIFAAILALSTGMLKVVSRKR